MPSSTRRPASLRSRPSRASAWTASSNPTTSRAPSRRAARATPRFSTLRCRVRRSSTTATFTTTTARKTSTAARRSASTTRRACPTRARSRASRAARPRRASTWAASARPDAPARRGSARRATTLWRSSRAPTPCTPRSSSTAVCARSTRSTSGSWPSSWTRTRPRRCPGTSRATATSFFSICLFRRARRTSCRWWPVSPMRESPARTPRPRSRASTSRTPRARRATASTRTRSTPCAPTTCAPWWAPGTSAACSTARPCATTATRAARPTRPTRSWSTWASRGATAAAWTRD